MKVLVGPKDITLSFSDKEKVNDEIVISTKDNSYAIITPHTPGFNFTPNSTGCFLLDSSESLHLFTLTPIDTGTFTISANVGLFKENHCSKVKKQRLHLI
ncbi:MAG: hypothetical protein JKY48_08225 [Flavobacteriales bacterium]|nr:hypothetical protein [Flavobacteriales bacterium]